MPQVTMEDLLKKVPNIYEAVIVAAKEARRINDRKLLEREQMPEQDDSNEEEYLVDELLQPIDYEEEEKVTVQALRHVLEGNVKYRIDEGRDEE